MDLLLSSNLYFLELADKWHPFISRLYFGIIFLLQTVRAQTSINVGSRNNKRFIQELLNEIAPESFPIPGPLVPVFKALSASESSSSRFGPVSPYLPRRIGPNILSQLYINGAAHAYELETPNIPLILYFINSILNADLNDILDYTNTNTFDNTVNHEIYGNEFEAERWTRVQKDYLMNPILLYSPESTPDLDFTFHEFGRDLGLPSFNEDDDVTEIEDFSNLSNSDWLSRLCKVMATYSSFFKHSSTLSECSPRGLQCSLVKSTFSRSSSQHQNENIYHTISHAFPDEHPHSYQAIHSSPENYIVQPYDSMAQYGSLHPTYTIRNFGRWSHTSDPIFTSSSKDHMLNFRFPFPIARLKFCVIF
ncbi:hypothetical protein WA026_017679 [Henosepilachna vigintioctopunctata]|uniref:Uncharacterized protein n=1 Tax=Henosepilachna vigintioctopunctata TaxID=420089 RepID=A0AAW1U0J9_9CUCU